MSLSDSLSTPSTPDARRTRAEHPATTYEAGELVTAAIPLRRVPEEAKWREEIARVTGVEVPDHREVILEGVRYWGNPDDLNVYCRFKIQDRPGSPSDVDAVRLLKDLREGRQRSKAIHTGETTLVVSWNDWQTGKAAGGGTAALAERLDGAYDGVTQRARELRKIGRDLGHLVIIGGGDMVEGCSIFPNQAYEIDGDRRTQVRNTTAFILEGIDRLAPQFTKVTLLVVGGNHGENRINGKRTTRGDNDDCAVFEHAALAVARDKRLSHVDFVIAEDEPAKTLDVHGHILATTHGHAFGRNVSGGPEPKALRWYSGQAAGHQPAGDAHVLVSHHFHHHASRDWGACQWVQTPAMDGGSPFFTDYSGQSAKPGMLTFVMTPEHRYVDAQVLG